MKYESLPTATDSVKNRSIEFYVTLRKVMHIFTSNLF